LKNVVVEGKVRMTYILTKEKKNDNIKRTALEKETNFFEGKIRGGFILAISRVGLIIQNHHHNFSKKKKVICLHY